MKYIGKKSLSSFLSAALGVLWWLLLAALIVYGVVVLINLFDITPGDPFTEKIATLDMNNSGGNIFFYFHWSQIVNWPVAVKIIVMAFFIACAVLRLIILRKAQRLFINFKNNIVFDKRNINIISSMSKLLIAAAIITYDFGTLFISILLLILCQIFRHGTALQEEHDLTV
jgi:hypothetical protein